MLLLGRSAGGGQNDKGMSDGGRFDMIVVSGSDHDVSIHLWSLVVTLFRL